MATDFAFCERCQFGNLCLDNMKEVVIFLLLHVYALGSIEENILSVVRYEFIFFSLNSQVHFSFFEYFISKD